MPSGERSIGHRDASRDVQLDLCPSLFLGRVDDGLFLRFCTSFDRIAMSIIPNNGGDLKTSRLVLLSGKPILRDNVSTRVSTATDGSKMGVRNGWRTSLRVTKKCGGGGTRGAYLVTSYIFGISPGSKTA